MNYINKIKALNYRYFDELNASTFEYIEDDLPCCTPDGYLIKFEQSNAIKKKVEVILNEVCVCKCDYKELVFAEIGAITTTWKNDKTSLLASKLATTDTIVISLKNNTTGVEKTITDNTYGTYYSTFTAQPLYVGFICDWNKVINDLGVGNYTFKIVSTILGEVSTYETYSYTLLEYSDDKANGTVKIESYNTGQILNSEFDYTDLLADGWYRSIRVGGKLLEKKPSLKVDNYYDLDNRLTQIQDRVDYEYDIETHFIPIEVANLLIEDVLLSNTIIVSDYNVFNEAQIKEIELYFNGVEKKTFTHNPNSIYKFKMKPRYDNIIKNNY